MSLAEPLLLETENPKWSENAVLDLKRVSLLLLFVRLLADNANRVLSQMQLSGPPSPYETRRPFHLQKQQQQQPQQKSEPPTATEETKDTKASASASASALPAPWTFIVQSGGVQRHSVFVIPRATQRRLARLAGTREVLGYDYVHRCVFEHWPYVAPRPLFKTVWRYRTQTAYAFIVLLI